MRTYTWQIGRRQLSESAPKPPRLYLRYLYDIFGIWEGSEEEVRQFVEILNKHHKIITQKANLQREKLEFLDTEVYPQRGEDGQKKLFTKVFFKTTDTHALLHKNSFHPKHTFKGIVKSQLIRFHRICTGPRDTEEVIGVLFKALRTRGYSRTFLRNIKWEVQTNFRENNSLKKNCRRTSKNDTLCVNLLHPRSDPKPNNKGKL